jgi:hypothetical protein
MFKISLSLTFSDRDTCAEFELPQVPSKGDEITVGTVNGSTKYRVLDRQFNVELSANLTQLEETPTALLHVEKV